MATKSMLRKVDIKEKYLARNLVNALEKSIQIKKKSTKMNIQCVVITKDNIKDIFG